MKKLMLMFICVAFSVAVLAQSQDNSQQNSQTPQQNSSQASQSSQTGQNNANNGNTSMSGSVSKDQKTFTDSKDNHTYKVDNPDALKGHGGDDNVGVIVAVDPDTNTIHIIQVAGPQ